MTAPAQTSGPAAGMPRFGGWAADYARFRPNYPDWVFDRLTEAAGAPFGHAVELGAGSGQATGSLLARYDRVTAVEPDADMAALIPPDDRLTVIVAQAERADFAPGSVDAVFAATSFHWMDQQAVSRSAGRWLRPGGAFMPASYGVMRVVAPAPAAAFFDRIEAEWSGLKHGILTGWSAYDAPMRASGAFARVEAISGRLGYDWTAAQAAGFFVTTSFGGEMAGQRGGLQAFAAELAEGFGGPDATVRAEAVFTAAIGWV